MPADTFHGLTVTFQSGFFGQITSISGVGASRGKIPTTHSATTGADTFMPSDLYTGADLQIEGHYDTAKNWLTALTAAAETVTITWPLASGQTVANSLAFSGFMTEFDASGPLDNSPQTGTFSCTICKADDLTLTVAS